MSSEEKTNEVKKIVNDVLDEIKKRKVPKFFQNPENSFGLCVALMYAVVISVMLNVLAIPLYNENITADKTPIFEKVALDHMDCKQVKSLLLDIDANHPELSKTTYTIQNQILGKC